MKKVILIITMSILILLYDRVSALTYTTDLTQVGSTYLQWNNFDNSAWTQSGDYYIRPINSLTTAQMQHIDITLVNEIHSQTIDYIQIPFNVSISSAQSTQNAFPNTICEEWQNVNGNWTCVSFTNNGISANFPYVNELDDMQFQIGVQYIDDNGNWNGQDLCDINNNTIICPTNHKKIKWMNINYILYSSSSTLYSRISLGAMWKMYNIASPTQAIQEQTQQQQQQYNGFMNSNQTYEDKQDTNIKGVNETMQFEQAESDLLESLDTNTSFIDSIVINPQASVFIWDIMEVLRNMNPAIILLMGSMLGFGIIKLVLNR